MNIPPIKLPKLEIMLNFTLGLLIVLASGCATQSVQTDEAITDGNPNRLLVVDCLLPGKIKKLGQGLTYLTPRRPIKSTAAQCEIRGGEYTAYDRANYATALKIWLPKAQEGDAAAQTYVGEIYEKGLGIQADYQLASMWYQKAAAQNYSRAMINLGYLYESGLGVPIDLTQAMNWYRKASGLTDGELEYVSSVEQSQRQATKLEHKKLQAEVGELRGELSQAQVALEKRQSDLQAERSKATALRTELEERKKAIALAPPAASPENPEDSQSLQDELDVAKKEQQRLTQSLAQQQRETRTLRQNLNQAQASLQDKQAALQSNRDKLEATQSQLEALKTSGASVQQTAEITRLNTELSQYQSTIDGQEQELTRLRLTQSDQNQQVQDNLQQAEQRQATLEKNLQQARAEQARLQQQLATAALSAEQTEKLKIELTQYETQQSEYQAQLSKSQQMESELRQQLESAQQSSGNQTELQNQLSQASTERQQLQGKLDTSRAEQQRLQQQLAQSQQGAAQQDTRIAALEQELAQHENEISVQENEINQLQGSLTQKKIQLKEAQADKVVTTVATGPSIEIIEPPLALMRSKPTAMIPPPAKTVNIIGRVSPAKDLLSFSINGQKQSLDANGLFQTSQPVNDPNTTINVVAVDKLGKRAALDFLLVPKQQQAASPAGKSTASSGSSATMDVDFGNYYALVIGNNNYANLTDLKTPENDANAIAEVLKSKYGFKTTLLLNANRYQLLSALNEMREKLTEKDNLLIYYAGHGELDPVNMRGYWLPVDADPGNSANWISNIAITDLLNVMTAKHVLVVADSCYSGSLTRSSVARLRGGMSNDARTKWYRTMSSARARAVLTSGDVKPVLDAGGGNHSLFAKAFLDSLNSNDQILEGYELYRSVQKRMKVATARLNVEQNPQYAPIKYAGHEAGEFLFLPATDSVSASHFPALAAVQGKQ
ncbi:MAG: hypothetical protein DSZ28_08700 [Thiothrix sp.]|nr:MAG: hypothetical protein DSZ28_08700 [Thiothrix sp.]